jgi:hypothetical protein
MKILYVIKYKPLSTHRNEHAALPRAIRLMREQEALSAVTRAVTAWSYRMA